MIYAALILVICVSFYKFLIRPVYLSPYAQIPHASFLSPVTSLLTQWKRFQGQEVAAFSAAFQKKGPIVRVGPNEIGINDIDAVKTVHGYGHNNCDKPHWYNVFAHNR